jgi:hypothetical protein
MALRVRRERRKTPGEFRLHKPKWQDPFPQIPGTEPEKRIFAALVERGIYFRYQADAPQEVVTANKMVRIAYVPDFALPEYKVVIDPFSPFHHSLPQAVDRDALKVARFTAAGWEYYHPWAYPDGMFSLDQSQHTLLLGERKWNTTKVVRDRQWDRAVEKAIAQVRKKGYKGKIKRPKPRYVKIVTPHVKPIVRAALGGDLQEDPSLVSATELLFRLPYIAQGPRFRLTDPVDIEAKRNRGYFIGTHVGLGATSVGAANRKRRRYPQPILRSPRSR